MKKFKSLKLVALMLTIALTVCYGIMPASVMAQNRTNEMGKVVAKVGDNKYTNLDTAIAEATDGAVVEVLDDCNTNGMSLSKNISFKGVEGVKPTITFIKDGISIWGKTLKFDNCKVIMKDIGGTPYAEWKWMTICASVNSSIELNNAEMLLDGKNIYDQNKHAIYFTGNNKLNLNNSTLKIANYKQDALEWDGGDGGYNANFKNSTFISDHNRSGFTGTFYATFDNSNVKVINSTGNGSNGTYYNVINNSDVLFQNNRNWGMSGYYIDVKDHSTIRALDNGFSGIWARALNVDSTCTIDIERNGNNSWGSKTNAGLFFQGNGDKNSVIEDGAKLIIKDNAGSGIYTKQGICNMTINTDAIITNNGLGTVDTYHHYGAKYGGGVYNVGTMVLSDKVVIYNNHANLAGDDIYSTKKITFGDVHKGWKLDGAPDCNGKIHAIDGWYVDAENETEKDEDGNIVNTLKYNRWNAHPAKQEDIRVSLLKEMGTHEGTVAYKAAHGMLDVDYKFVSGTEGKELPKEVLDLLPVDENKYEYGANVNAMMPSASRVEVLDGVWEFKSYDQNEIKDLQVNGLFVGTWVFVPNVYHVDYEFVSGTVGKELPKEVLDLLPTDTNDYLYGSNVNAMMPSSSKVEVSDGVWEFKSYDQNEIKNLQANGLFVGTWEFTANVYHVDYEFVSGTEGKELPKEVLDLLPNDSNEYKSGSTVSAIMPSRNVVVVSDGTWTFNKYDKNEIQNITSNGKFVGYWTFESKKLTSDNSNEQNKPTPTGDEHNVGLYGAMLTATGVGLLVALRKRKED